MDYDPDPAPRLEGDSVLERISRAHEAAVDNYTDAANASAVAQNEYLRLFQIAYTQARVGKVPVTILKLECNNDPDVCVALRDWNLALAAEKSARAKADELGDRQTAAMSRQRFIREGTGA